MRLGGLVGGLVGSTVGVGGVGGMVGGDTKQLVRGLSAAIVGDY
jgi:hypothetical protein